MASLKLSPGVAPKWEAQISDPSQRINPEFQANAMDWSKPIGGPAPIQGLGG